MHQLKSPKSLDKLLVEISEWEGLPPSELREKSIGILRKFRVSNRGFSTVVGIHMDVAAVRSVRGRKSTSKVMLSNLSYLLDKNWGRTNYGSLQPKEFNSEGLFQLVKFLQERIQKTPGTAVTTYERNLKLRSGLERLIRESGDYNKLSSYFPPTADKRYTTRLGKDLYDYLELFQLTQGIPSLGLAATLLFDPTRSKW